jgi:pyrroline-5-carboxylate reductase
MKKRYKLGVIGCGFMAGCILGSVVTSDTVTARKIIVSDRSEQKLKDVNAEFGVAISTDNRTVAENSEYLLLAVKPQNFEEVAKDLTGIRPEKVISIMAGVKKITIKKGLGLGVKVARCMPNLPCSIGEGAMGVDMTDFNSNPDDIEFITNLFSSMGSVLSVTEDKLHAVTGISGSGPAYVFLFLDALIDAGVKQGLTKDEAKLLAVQTVIGSAQLVNENEQTIPELVKRVCSKGGTTIEAVKVFEDKNFRGIVGDAVDACVKRSVELSEKS